jgi:hypothetical protein
MVIAASALALAAAGMGIFAIGADRVLTHDLLSADFTEGDDTFKSGATAEYALDQGDGSYRLASTTEPTSPLVTFGWFARTASYVDIQATIVEVEADDPAIGIECVHKATSGANAGYAFIYIPGDGYVLAEANGADNGVDVIESVRGEPPRAGQHIGISCGVASPLPGATTKIAGGIDGTVLIQTTDDAYESFAATALLFWPSDANEWIRFDDVTAEVPGS